MQHSTYHIPALLEDAVNLLNIKPDGVYVDVTFGGGGHSRAILEKLGPQGRLLSFDRDIEAYANNIDDPRFTFVHSNFRYLPNFLRFYSINKVDGILGDLGVSFHHFDSRERGFSFRSEAPLDMRMNRGAEVTAADIIAEADEKELNRIIKTYADLKKPGNVVKAILTKREKNPILTTTHLVKAVSEALDPRQEKKELAQVFQAFRIETNGESDDLRIFLNSTLPALNAGGRLVILTYHSVEDRMVKNFMKTGNVEGIEKKDFYGNMETPWIVITRKPILPDSKEIEENPRSRSAKLRAAEKK